MNKETAKVGNKYNADGLDMQCRNVVVVAKLLRVLDVPTATGFVCVVESDGVRSYAKLAELRVFTKEDFAAMRAKAEAIMAAHEMGAEADAGFDGGEWSGPAHADMMEEALTALAVAYGVTYEYMMQELWAAHAADVGPHGPCY